MVPGLTGVSIRMYAGAVNARARAAAVRARFAVSSGSLLPPGTGAPTNGSLILCLFCACQFALHDLIIILFRLSLT